MMSEEEETTMSEEKLFRLRSRRGRRTRFLPPDADSSRKGPLDADLDADLSIKGPPEADFPGSHLFKGRTFTTEPSGPPGMDARLIMYFFSNHNYSFDELERLEGTDLRNPSLDDLEGLDDAIQHHPPVNVFDFVGERPPPPPGKRRKTPMEYANFIRGLVPVFKFDPEVHTGFNFVTYGPNGAKFVGKASSLDFEDYLHYPPDFDELNRSYPTVVKFFCQYGDFCSRHGSGPDLSFPKRPENTYEQLNLYHDIVGSSEGFDAPKLPNPRGLIQPIDIDKPGFRVRDATKFAIDFHNGTNKDGQNLELKEIIKCTVDACCHLHYYITFYAVDMNNNNEVDMYEAKVASGIAWTESEVITFRKATTATKVCETTTRSVLTVTTI